MIEEGENKLGNNKSKERKHPTTSTKKAESNQFLFKVNIHFAGWICLCEKKSQKENKCKAKIAKG